MTDEAAAEATTATPAQAQADHESAIRAAVTGELQLLDPAVRRSRKAVSALLDPDFVEFGRSGRRWDRDSTLEALATEEPIRTTVSAMSGTLLAPNLVHLTFRTESTDRHTLRSSLWRHSPEGWRMYFHQATPTSAGTSHWRVSSGIEPD
ncbi:DUF4440 domain-containing protein [Embleya sp. MST-111070]|uniref:nuclear transport factor 2 family protein n=1 Tax=Embleya sp. MST-111070 TaxID=3398231 RepID=UPI003F73E0E0